MKDKIPRILYKYKSIQSLDDVKRLLDVFKNNRLYFPNYKELNDPLEGAGHNIVLPGWAGKSVEQNADIELSPIEELKGKFRILSLSEESKSPQLWAHYAGNYSGVCLCFSSEGMFHSVEQVTYTDKKIKKKPLSREELERCIRDGLYEKHSGWAYEKEWRIVEKSRKKYYQFNKKDLLGIIIGQRMEPFIQELIVNSIPLRVKVMKTHIGYQIPRINLLPYDYEYEYNGEKIQYIGDVVEYLI